jgi:hypothetical protein
MTRTPGPAPVYGLNAQRTAKFRVRRSDGGNDARPAKADERQKSLNRLGDSGLSLHAVMALARIGERHQGE